MKLFGKVIKFELVSCYGSNSHASYIHEGNNHCGKIQEIEAN